MSNSAKAKERRSKRGRATKNQRAVMATNPTRVITSVKRSKAKVIDHTPTKSAPIEQLSAIEQKMAEMRDKL